MLGVGDGGGCYGVSGMKSTTGSIVGQRWKMKGCQFGHDGQPDLPVIEEGGRVIARRRPIFLGDDIAGAAAGA